MIIIKILKVKQVAETKIITDSKRAIVKTMTHNKVMIMRDPATRILSGSRAAAK